MQDLLTIFSWVPLVGGRGTSLTVAGERSAAAELARLTVWSGERLVAQINATAPTPGWPRFAGERVLWGDGVLVLASGVYQRVLKTAGAVAEGGGVPTEPSPRGGYRPAAYAWSTDGDALVVSAAWTGASGSPPARVVLVDSAGQRRATLWESVDVAPTAVWVGREFIVVGSRNARVFDRVGTPIANLTNITSAARIDASADEARLLIVEHGRLSMWETAGWMLLASWDGNWLDAAITTDGHTIVAVDLNGQLFVVRAEDGQSSLINVAVPDPVTSVALGTNRILASFAAGDPVRTAAFTIT